MKFEHLRLTQLDEQLKNWDMAKKQAKPQKGWVNLIRTILGMSSRQLAKRMGVNQARVIQIESAEQREAITLKTLAKAAKAMGCELVYAIVPHTTLDDVLKNQAKKLAEKRLGYISHSMGLEAQKVAADKEQQQLENLIKELLNDSPKKLWKEE